MKFGSVLTITGQAKVAAALQPGGTPLTISKIALGDGGGAAVTPSENRAELINERHRQPIDSAEPHPTDASSVVIQAVIPQTTGGFWIREIGLYDIDGDLVAYGSFPATEKPVLSAGVGRELIIRTHLAVASTEAVTILIDPSIIHATQAWVNLQLTWGNIDGKPTTFPPATHTHPYLPLTGGTLDGHLLAKGFLRTRATSGSNAVLFLQDADGKNRGNVFWDRANTKVQISRSDPTTGAFLGWARINADNTFQTSHAIIAPGFNGVATSANKLHTSPMINGTAFNGTANIVTTRWGAERTLKIGNQSQTVNGTANITWTLTDIGAAPVSHTHTSAEVVEVHRARRYFFNQL